MLFSCTEDILEVDLLIKNGIVYNGKDSIPSQTVIAVLDDKIVFIGAADEQKIQASKTIDAKGMIVCPGFIDPHTHADRELKEPDKSHNHPFLMQGVTTVVVGSDGKSFFPTQEFKDAVYEARHWNQCCAPRWAWYGSRDCYWP